MQADTANPHARTPVVYAGARLADAALAVIDLHGRNLGAPSALELASRLATPGVAFVIPEAADRTWYPGSFLAPVADNQPHLDHARACVDALVADLGAAGFEASRIWLVGFSQGACLALDWLSHQPARVGGVIAFTGGLIGPPDTRWPIAPRITATPILLTTSELDTWVPIARVRETASVLTARGAIVELHVFRDRAHEVSAAEIELARATLRAAAERATAPRAAAT